MVESHDNPSARSALAEVVHDLEDVTGAPLGATRLDPHVLLLRRFARVHGLLLSAEHQPDADRLRRHAITLRSAAAAPVSSDSVHALPPVLTRTTATGRRGLARARA